MRTIAILPVKGFAGAKQRLTAGLSPEQRQALAEAMFCDVLRSLGKSSMIHAAVVVTAGERARALALDHGARVVADEEHGHNAAARIGIKSALEDRADRALLVPGDCPALDSHELDQLLQRPAARPSVLIIPDRHGTGTNALALTPPDALAPSFGPGSCERHAAHARAAGVDFEVVQVPSLAIDIDTPEDLEALEASRGAAEQTRRLLSDLTLSGKC